MRTLFLTELLLLFFGQLLVGDDPSSLHFQCHQREFWQHFNFREVHFL